VDARSCLPDAHLHSRMMWRCSTRSWPGAAGYLLKQMRGADLVGAVRTVAAGLMRLDNRTTAQIVIGAVQSGSM
jgi:hypothetical protein